MCRIVSTTAFSVFIIVSALLLIKMGEVVALDAIYDTYGKYTISIEGETSAIYEQVEADVQVEDSIRITEKMFEKDGCEYTVYYASSQINEFKNITIVEGGFPVARNEVLIERSYLFHLGIAEDEMIGTTITLPIDQGKGGFDSSMQAVVTGIISVHEVMEPAWGARSVVVVFPEDAGACNKLLIQLKSVKDYKQIAARMTRQYGVNEETCYVNFNLLMALGIPLGQSQFDVNGWQYGLVFAIMLFCSTVILLNYLKIMLYHHSAQIVTLNLLGISRRMIGSGLIVSAMISMLIGMGIGIACGIAGVGLYFSKQKEIGEAFYFVMQNFPLKTMMFSIVGYLVVAMLTIIPIVCHIKKISSYRMVQAVGKSKKNRHNRHLLKAKTKFVIIRFAYDSIVKNQVSFFATVAALSIATAMLTIGIFQTKVNISLLGHDPGMDYKVAFLSDYALEEGTMKENVEAIYQELSDMTQLLRIYPIYTSWNKVDIDKKMLPKAYIKYLSQSVMNKMSLAYGRRESIPLVITILGYNQKQLQELYALNGLTQEASLGDDEVVLLNQTLPYRGEEGFALNVKDIDTIDLNLEVISSGERIHDFNVKTTVERLAIYPQDLYSYNTICVVINEAAYQKWCSLEVPNEFYIKLQSGTDKNKARMESLLAREEIDEVSKPAEMEREVIEETRFLKGKYIAFFVLTLMIVAIVLTSTLAMRIYTKKLEYILLRTIGLPLTKLAHMIHYEIFGIFLCSEFLAYAITYIGTFYIQTENLAEAGKYSYKFPYPLFFMASGIVFLVLCLISIPTVKRFKQMNISSLMR
ncbi:hypothetical protein LQZ18_15040 [Lachnospiraceae bacterium ZAX-1]